MLVSITACGQTETAKESTAESQETTPVTIPASESVEAVNEVSEATTESDVDEKENVRGKELEQEADTMVLEINGERASVKWEDNESVEALKNVDELAEILGNEDVTITIDSE